jgi:hypothetical protein
MQVGELLGPKTSNCIRKTDPPGCGCRAQRVGNATYIPAVHVKYMYVKEGVIRCLLILLRWFG